MKTPAFGRLLAEGCARQGVSQYRFAKLLGVQQSRVPQILKAKNLTERTFRRGAKALGLELDCKLVKPKQRVS